MTTRLGPPTPRPLGVPQDTERPLTRGRAADVMTSDVATVVTTARTHDASQVDPGPLTWSISTWLTPVAADAGAVPVTTAGASA